MTTSDQNQLPFEPNLPLISHALSRICGKWRLFIMLVLGEQTLRYTQLSERLPGVSEKVLAGELKALVALGMLQRVAYAQVPSHVTYCLTDKGRLALPLMRQIQLLGQVIT